MTPYAIRDYERRAAHARLRVLLDARGWNRLDPNRKLGVGERRAREHSASKHPSAAESERIDLAPRG
jgi:hypothetical protein